MTGPEIKAKIDENCAKIESMLDPTKFVLNNDIKELLDENIALQKQCQHEFDQGYCIYCQRKEG